MGVIDSLKEKFEGKKGSGEEPRSASERATKRARDRAGRNPAGQDRSGRPQNRPAGPDQTGSPGGRNEDMPSPPGRGSNGPDERNGPGRDPRSGRPNPSPQDKGERPPVSEGPRRDGPDRGERPPRREESPGPQDRGPDPISLDEPDDPQQRDFEETLNREVSEDPGTRDTAEPRGAPEGRGSLLDDDRRSDTFGGQKNMRGEVDPNDMPPEPDYNMDLPRDDAGDGRTQHDMKEELHQITEQNERIIDLLRQIKNGLRQR